MAIYPTVTKSGAGPHSFFPQDLGGKNPAYESLDLQVNADGLDGGSYTVEIGVSGVVGFKEVKAGALEADSVVISRAVSFSVVRVSFSALGGAASPVVAINRKDAR